MTPHESDKAEDLDDCEQGKAQESNTSADSEPTDGSAEQPAGQEPSNRFGTTKAAARDRTITMILNSAGKDGVALGSTSGTHAFNSIKTMKKVLVDDEGIIADEDKYDVKGLLAKGGMGMVMAAQDVNIRRDVAVKVMLAQDEEDTDNLLRFVEEAQVTGQLEHPNIVPVHELGVQPSGQIFYTMKMIKGRTLKDILRKIRKGDKATITEFHLTRLMTIFMKICDAVSFAHDRKVIHRDLKPDNVMVGGFGEVLVVDWGLAKILKQKTDDSITIDDTKFDDAAVESVRNASGSTGHVTMEGKVMGTPRYMAPEQAMGEHSKMDCRADIYSLGAILYNILTLHSHVQGDDVQAILRKTLLGEYDPIETYEEGYGLPHCPDEKLPTGLKAITQKCIQVAPKERYQDVQDLQRDVEAWQEGFATKAEEATLARQLALLVARHKATFSVAGAALLALAIFGALAFKEIVKERDAAEDARKEEAIARKIAETERKNTAAALKLEEKAKQRAITERMYAIDAREKERIAKDKERKAREKAEWANYCNTLHLVKSRIDEGSFDQAQALLWSLPKDLRRWEWGYLLKRSSPELISLKHQGSVFTAQFSPDGTRIACGGGRGMITIWDVATGRRLRAWKGHRHLVQSVTFSPDGKRILTNGNGKTAIVWDVASGKKVLTLSVEGNVSIDSGAFTTDGRRIVTVTGPNAYGSNGEKADELTPLYGGTLGISRKFSFPGYESFSKAGDQIILQEASTAIQVWDAATGERLPNDSKEHPTLSAELFPESKRLAVVNDEDPAMVRIWDFETSKVVCQLRGHDERVRSVVFSTDGRRILTASDDKTARLWDAKTGEALAVYVGHSDSLCSASFSPDGRRIITTACDDSAKVWDAACGDSGMALDSDKYTLKGAFSADGTRIVTAGADARIWDTKTGRQLLVHKSEGSGFNSAIFSPDGAWVLDVGFGKAHVWNAKTGSERLLLKDPAGWIDFAVYSRDGKQIVTAGPSVKVRFWDAQTGRQLNVWTVGKMEVRTLAFSPDGSCVATTGTLARDKPKIREIATGLETMFMNSVQSGFRSPTFSPDGKQIVAAGYKVARLWSVESGNELVALKGHGDLIESAAFSPDAIRVITACRDKTVRLWDTRTGRELLNLSGYKGSVYGATFSPDGMRLLITSEKEKPRVLEAYNWGIDEDAFYTLKLNVYKTSLRPAATEK